MSTQLVKTAEHYREMANKQVVDVLNAGGTPVLTFSKINDLNKFFVKHNLGSLRLKAELVIDEEALQALRAAATTSKPAKEPKPTKAPAPMVNSSAPVAATANFVPVATSTPVATIPSVAPSGAVKQDDWE